MISISIFIISLVGISSLIGISLWEKRRGKKVFAEQRQALDIRIVALTRIITERVAQLNGRLFLQIYHHIVHVGALIVLQVVRVVEKRTVKVLDTVRGKRELSNNKTQSVFLKQVRSHKEQLEKTVDSPVE
jgi:hypothetical protein